MLQVQHCTTRLYKFESTFLSTIASTVLSANLKSASQNKSEKSKQISIDIVYLSK